MKSMQNIPRAVAVITMLAVLLAVVLPAWAAKEARAARFDVNVAAQADGSVRVTETVVFVYTGGPFTYVTRDIPAERTDGLVEFEAYMDGTWLPLGGQPGQVEISGRDPVRIVWHFAPTSDATHEFTVVYCALGVVEKTGEADVLRWQALPDEHDYLIESSTVTVTYPPEAQPLLAPTVEGATASVESQSSEFVSVARNLGPNATLIVEQRFALNTLTTATPNWQAQARAERTARYAPGMLGLAGLVLLAGIGGAYLAWRRIRPEPAPDPGFISAPPSDLPPALVGALSSGTGEPSAATAVGTLFDLARRGVVIIDERLGTGWLRRRNFIVTLRDRSADLRLHEAALLDEVFGPAAMPGASANLMDRINSLLSHWKRFGEPIKAEVRQAGWLDENRLRQRALWMGGGVLLTLVGLLGLVLTGIALVPLFGIFVMLVPLALLIAMALVVGVGAAISPYTEQGRQAAARWKAFGKYLEAVTRGREAVTRPDLFERYLPYAAGLGLAERWIGFFKRRGEAGIPAWFQPLTAGDTSGFVAMVAATSATAISSGAAGAAGAGAAGGGASGTG